MKQKSRKLLYGTFISIVLIASIIVGGCIAYEMKRVQTTVDTAVLGMMEQVKTQYPDVKEEEIIKILNEPIKPSKETRKLAEQYGLLVDNTSILLELEKAKTSILYNMIGVIISIGIIGILAIYLEGRRNDRKIRKIQQYIEQINQKKYTLKMDENTEDALSKLSSELYKITVMLKEQAETSKKEKEHLQESISDISHQIKTPLTSISIMLDNLQENPQMEEETKNAFRMEIRRQIEWIEWLIYALLKLARLDAGVVVFQKDTICLKELVQSVIEHLSIPIEIKNQVVEVKGSDAITIQGDFAWQKEALTNIVKNAIEHTPEGKKITITIEENPLYAKIMVADEGEGIDKEDVKHIFKRFYKAKNASENSVGIGLALAKSIIEKQEGYITCSSKKGEGSTFEIRYMK